MAVIDSIGINKSLYVYILKLHTWVPGIESCTLYNMYVIALVRLQVMTVWNSFSTFSYIYIYKVRWNRIEYNAGFSDWKFEHIWCLKDFASIQWNLKKIPDEIVIRAFIHWSLLSLLFIMVSSSARENC